MFKKKPTIKALAPLRSSDRRKLADKVIHEYQLDPVQEPQQDQESAEQKAEATTNRTSLRNALFPENLQSARFTTTHGPDLRQAAGTIYVGSQTDSEARVLWFQIEERVYPSVYTLWANPNVVPLLHTPSVVVTKIQGGADLMTPGLAGGPPFPSAAVKGATVAIASTDSPSVPVAVGQCKIDVSALGSVQGAKGHAVEMVHWAGDELWAFGASGKVGQQPPAEVQGWKEVLEERGLLEKVGSLDLDDRDDGGVNVDVRDNFQQEGNSSDQKVDDRPLMDFDEAPDTKDIDMSQKEIDEAFRNAFLFGVYQHKTSNPGQSNFGLDFPLSQSFVMSTLIQPFLPAFTPHQNQQLQIKKSSWKNIKKFIKSLDKVKLIKSKEKDGHETVILDIDFDDAAIVNFTPYRLPKKETASGTTLGRGETATSKIDTSDDSLGQKLKVISLFKQSNKLQALFSTAGHKTYLSQSEVREAVNAYVESENLVSETNKRLVKLNPTLANAVFDGSSKLDAEVIAKGLVPRDALIDRISQAMSPSWAIIRNDADPSGVKAKSGTAPKILITLETRSGSKTVTKVSGLEAYHVNPRPLADELRKVCAGSTSVEPLAGAAKKNEKEIMEVMIQGPQKDAVLKALEKRGVDKRWVEYIDKTKGKKR